MSEPIHVINIVAVSYSGSTWANLLLGSHSQAASIGEMDGILKYGKAICSLHPDNCPVWSNFKYDPAQNIYLQLAQVTGKRYLVVNNTQKFLADQKHPDIKSWYVMLIRDGRAVVASSMRKYPDQGIWKASRSWARSIRKKHKLVNAQDPATRLILPYEKFAGSPAEYLGKICDMIGLAYEPAMLEFWKADHHFLGGNGGPLLAIAEYQNLQLEVQQVRQANARPIDREHYAKVDPSAYVDERWKTELSDMQLRLFGLLAGRWNRRLGYPKPLDRG